MTTDLSKVPLKALRGELGRRLSLDDDEYISHRIMAERLREAGYSVYKGSRDYRPMSSDTEIDEIDRAIMKARNE